MAGSPIRNQRKLKKKSFAFGKGASVKPRGTGALKEGGRKKNFHRGGGWGVSGLPKIDWVFLEIRKWSPVGHGGGRSLNSQDQTNFTKKKKPPFTKEEGTILTDSKYKEFC